MLRENTACNDPICSPVTRLMIGRYVVKSFLAEMLTGRTCRETVGTSRIIEDLYPLYPNSMGKIPPPPKKQNKGEANIHLQGNIWDPYTL